MSSDQLIIIGVYRDQLANQEEAVARPAHNRRAAALHDALNDSAYRVESWGLCDDQKPHEFVDLTISVLAYPATTLAASAALGFMSAVLKDVIKDVVKGAVVDLVGKLVKGMRAKPPDIGDFVINLPGGNRVQVAPDATLTIVLAHGKVASIAYDARSPSEGKIT